MKIDTSSWKEFKIGELFNLEKGKISSISDYKLEGNIPYVGCTNKNNGIMGYYDIPTDKITKGGCICFVGNGDGSAGLQVYRENDFACSSGNICGYAKWLNDKNANFIITILDKQQIESKMYSHSNGRNIEKLKNQKLLLPVKEIDIPDFEYMEEYIKELEQERIKELEQYLLVTGLNDYELTKEDKEVLSKKVEFKEFRLNNLFYKKTMKGYPKSKENLIENKDGYYIYGQNIKRQYSKRVLLDEIYLHKVNESNPILAYTSSVGEIGMIEENFYRSGDNGAFQGLFSKEYLFNRYELQYILSILKKQFTSFGYSTGMADIINLNFILPIKTNDKGNPIIDSKYTYHEKGYIPDFEYMEQYIRIQEKLAIKDIVLLKDKIIDKTKEIVNSES